MIADAGFYLEFDAFDRFGFPKGIARVTAGHGGESLLISGSEKTALLDCGMAYCAGGLIENIERELGGRSLDFVLLSHTHYDHIGALPFIRRRWPGATTFGAAHARAVLQKQGAIKTINSLSEQAGVLYEGEVKFRIPDEGFAVDRIVGDGDKISLGAEEFNVLETKGHTDCSLSFGFEPLGVLFLSESTGCLDGYEMMHVSILKSYREAMASVEKCRNYGAKTLVSPHYGLIPEYYNERYWDLFVSETEGYKEFLFGLFASGLPEEVILEKYSEKYWNARRKAVQPKDAFLLNARNVIKVFYDEFRAGGEGR